MWPSAHAPSLVATLDLIFGSGMQIFGAIVAVVALTWGLGAETMLTQIFGTRRSALIRSSLWWLRWVVPAVLLVIFGLYVADSVGSGAFEDALLRAQARPRLFPVVTPPAIKCANRNASGKFPCSVVARSSAAVSWRSIPTRCTQTFCERLHLAGLLDQPPFARRSARVTEQRRLHQREPRLAPAYHDDRHVQTLRQPVHIDDVEAGHRDPLEEHRANERRETGSLPRDRSSARWHWPRLVGPRPKRRRRAASARKSRRKCGRRRDVGGRTAHRRNQ